jgi:hypothetical protein
MSFFIKMLPFGIIGAAVGSGSFNVFDWQWWAWTIPLNLSIIVRDNWIRAED